MTELDPKFIVPVVPNWLTAAGIAIGAWLAKLIMGRHLKALDKVVALSEKTHDTVQKIDKRVSRIEGRFKQMDAK